MDKFLEGKVIGYLTVVLNLMVSFLAVFEPGLEVFGFISLFTLGILINQQLTGFLGENYLGQSAERENTANLVVISYLGCLLVHLILLPVYLWFHPFGIQYLPEFFTLSIMHGLLKNNLLILYGKGKKGMVSLLELFQVTMLLMVFGLFQLRLEVHEFQYILALGISLFMTMAGSMGLVLNEMPKGPEQVWRTAQRMIQMGFTNQLGGLIHLLTTRLSYFFISGFLGLTALGEFTLFVQFAETIGIFKRPAAKVDMIYHEKKGTFEKLVSVSRESIKWHLLNTLFVFLGAGILFLSINHFLAGHYFQYPGILLGILFPGTLALKAYAIMEQYFGGTQYQTTHFKITLLVFSILLILNIMVINIISLPLMGFMNSLAYFLLAGNFYLIIKRSFRLDP